MDLLVTRKNKLLRTNYRTVCLPTTQDFCSWFYFIQHNVQYTEGQDQTPLPYCRWIYMEEESHV